MGVQHNIFGAKNLWEGGGKRVLGTKVNGVWMRMRVGREGMLTNIMGS